MENRPIQSGKRYLLAFLIGTFIFINGFALTYGVSYLEYQRISNTQDELSYEIFKDKLYYSFFEQEVCSLNSLEKISLDLRFQGKIIDDLEKKFGKNHEKVLFRKKFYSLIELEHFEFVKQINEKCDSNISMILFFYSNLDEDIEKSEDVGKLLDIVYNRNQDIIIYVFDINLEDNLIDSLELKYNVLKSPTIIVNEGNKIVHPRNIVEIEQYLG